MDAEGYKGFSHNLMCRDFSYKIKETFTMKERAELGKRGFHFCQGYPAGVLYFYTLLDSNANLNRFAKVSANYDDIVVRNGLDPDYALAATNKLRIVEELSICDLIDVSIDYIRSHLSTPDEAIYVPSSERNCRVIYKDNTLLELSSQISENTIFINSNVSKIIDNSERPSIFVNGNRNDIFIGNEDGGANITMKGTGNGVFVNSSLVDVISSGYYSQIFTRESGTKIISSGVDAVILSFGEASNIISSGYGAIINTCGMCANIVATGDNNKIVCSGNNSTVRVLGRRSKCTLENMSATVCVQDGFDNSVKGVEGSQIIISCSELTQAYVSNLDTYPTKKSYFVGEGKIKANTWYNVVDGELVEAERVISVRGMPNE